MYDPEPALDAPLATLVARADALRRAWVGDAVHLRALVEISSFCRRRCGYCGLAAGCSVPRYRLDSEQVLACAREARRLGLGTIVLQAGEDPGLREDDISELVRRIRGETGLTVTLSLGERPVRSLAAWRMAGAERYLMRFESSCPELYRQAHPDSNKGLAGRLEQLCRLDALGYQVGTGFLVGLPGQDRARLHADLDLVARLRPHMIGIGPWVAHPDTPLGERASDPDPGLAERVLRCLAWLRIRCPWAHIPATSAFQVTAGLTSLRRALEAGASVIMPDFTPTPYRSAYAIYPGKGADSADPAAQVARLRRLIHAAGRSTGRGAGSPERPALDLAPTLGGDHVQR
jgi:biotin synthase